MVCVRLELLLLCKCILWGSNGRGRDESGDFPSRPTACRRCEVQGSSTREFQILDLRYISSYGIEPRSRQVPGFRTLGAPETSPFAPLTNQRCLYQLFFTPANTFDGILVCNFPWQVPHPAIDITPQYHSDRPLMYIYPRQNI